MTGTELKAIRQALGMSLQEFAYAIGYRGNRNSRSVAVRRMESGVRPINELRAIKAKMLLEEKAKAS